MIKWEKITKKAVDEKQNLKPKRCWFAEHNRIKISSKTSFSVPFGESIQPIFEKMTGYKLFESKKYKNYYRYINNEIEQQVIEEWTRKQDTRIFLRSCLPISVALAFNFKDNTSGDYTYIGELEKEAQNLERDSINKLVDKIVSTIEDLPFYRDADFICAVPSLVEDFYLPREITSAVSQKINKCDVTSGFSFECGKRSIKETAFEEKWDILDQSGLDFKNTNDTSVKNKKIILIDDKYQSGISIQFVAMKLQQAGASQVYGLSIVKTLRDTDNQI